MQMEGQSMESGGAGVSECPQIFDAMMNLDTSPLGTPKTLELDGKATANQNSQKKRKRACMDWNLTAEDKLSLIKECQQELDELFEFYKGVSSYKLHLEEVNFPSLNSAVACILEESTLSFSGLVDEIYSKMKAKEGNHGATLASVRSAVLFVGQRMLYGVVNEDVDVLEDESKKCLWCWETRDMKLLPKTQRGFFSIRRIGRKKIHERISLLSSIISALSMSAQENYRSDLMKAYQRLQKVLNLSEISSLVEKLKQKSSVDMAEKEAKLKEKELIKQLERNKQNAEMERKRIDQDIQKEKQQAEKELKKIQEEAALEERRNEKEKAELRKQIKKQELQAKRDQQRLEKESAELKKQLKVQKQATLMERFLKRTKLNDAFELMLSKEELVPEATCKSESMVNTTSSLMDHALLLHDSFALEDLRSKHIARWHKGCLLNRFRRWGIRSKPKVNLVQDLKLLGSSLEAAPLDKLAFSNKDLTNKKPRSSQELLLDLELGESLVTVTDCNDECHSNNEIIPASCLAKKLLQFDKSNRPAYYGTWRRKRCAVGPRNPFRKDPGLDYEVDSDEEWEEEEPGESLSDCEDKEDEPLDEDLKACSDDESVGSFVVPDGYVSENEGVQVEQISNSAEEEARNMSFYQIETENEEFRVLFQQQKYLSNLTEQALRKCQPVIITNLFHEKTATLNADILDGTARLEQICLQALSIRACPGVSAIDNAPTDLLPNKDQEYHHSQANNNNNINTSPSNAAVIPDSDLPEFIRAIQSFPQSINKVVESIQVKFSSISKSQIKFKVREISDFSDHRWQVKKEVLDRLGLSPSMSKCSKEKGIAKFFTKRCLPPQFPDSSPK